MTASESVISAFLELIAQKPFHNITVRNIIERAHVHRSTFYAFQIFMTCVSSSLHWHASHWKKVFLFLIF